LNHSKSKKLNGSGQFFRFGFQCVAKNINKALKFCTSYLIYNQIWLNLPKDDHLCFLHLPIYDHHFGCTRKFLMKTLIKGDRSMNEHFKSQKGRIFTHFSFILLKAKRTFVTLHLTFPMPQKLFNSIKEWGRYGVFIVRGFSV